MPWVTKRRRMNSKQSTKTEANRHPWEWLSAIQNAARSFGLGLGVAIVLWFGAAWISGSKGDVVIAISLASGFFGLSYGASAIGAALAAGTAGQVRAVKRRYSVVFLTCAILIACFVAVMRERGVWMPVAMAFLGWGIATINLLRGRYDLVDIHNASNDPSSAARASDENE